jgi:hypothetical protein
VLALGLYYETIWGLHTLGKTVNIHHNIGHFRARRALNYQAFALLTEPLRREYQFARLAKRFSDFHLHRSLIPGAYPTDLIFHLLTFEAGLLPRASQPQELVLDPFYRLISDEDPAVDRVLTNLSATVPMTGVPYSIGGQTFTTVGDIQADPIELYQLPETQPLHTFPFAKSRDNPLQHSFVFDSEDVYGPIYSEDVDGGEDSDDEFLHFVTFPDVDDDYLSAVGRYEAAMVDYFNPDLRRWKLALADFIAPGDEGDKPFVTDHSVRWLNEWGLLPIHTSYIHHKFDLDLYPLRPGGIFGRRDLSGYRAARRMRGNAAKPKTRNLFRYIRNGLRSRVSPHKTGEAKRGYALKNIERGVRTINKAADKRPNYGQLPLLVDRLLATADATRIRSLRSIYFTEYRKLLSADLNLVGRRYEKASQKPGATIDLSKVKTKSIAELTAKKPSKPKKRASITLISPVKILTQDVFGYARYLDNHPLLDQLLYVTEEETTEWEEEEEEYGPEMNTAEFTIDQLAERLVQYQQAQVQNNEIAAAESLGPFRWIYDPTTLSAIVLDGLTNPVERPDVGEVKPAGVGEEEEESDYDLGVRDVGDEDFEDFVYELDREASELDNEILGLFYDYLDPDAEGMSFEPEPQTSWTEF